MTPALRDLIGDGQERWRTAPAARVLLSAGLIGPPLFCAVFLVEGAIHPAYSAWRDTVSLLSRGSQGWVQIANFLVFGALMIAFAFGLRARLRPGRAGTWGPALFGVFGVSLLLAGVFVSDPAGGGPIVITGHGLAQTGSQATSAGGVVHNLSALVGFGSLTASTFVLARRFRVEGRHRLAGYSRVSGVWIAALFLLATQGPGGWPGLVQRASIAVGWLWITVIAAELRPI